jgi:hypothetical protein
MELFIQIRDGQPYQHPIFEDNFRQVFSHIDTNNLPPEFARFVRTKMPTTVGVFQKVVERYMWDGEVIRDDWLICDMTAEEKAAKIEAEKSQKPEGDQWVFDEELLQWLDSTLVNLNTNIGVSSV